MEKTRVFISDPQVLFREGIHFVLSGEEDFDVTGETTDNGEAVSLIQMNPPHVAILSLADGRLDGAEAARRIKRNMPSVALILTVENREPGKLMAAIKSGAHACLVKDAGPEHLLELVREVAHGGLPAVNELLLPGIASQVLGDFEGLAALNERLDNLLASLSPRETQVLKGIVAGNNPTQIASQLEINEDAVRRSLKAVLTKLVVNDQATSVLEAARKSLPVTGAGPAYEAPHADYVTREEFRDFQKTLLAALRSIIGEKPLKR
jgi:two-component system NarL family response regulator